MKTILSLALLLSIPLSALASGGLQPAQPGGRSFWSSAGASTRQRPDPGPIRKMWVVYRSPEELKGVRRALELIIQANPAVDIVERRWTEVLPTKKDERGVDIWDDDPELREPLFKRLKEEGVDFVLGTDQDIYEGFNSLRYSELARELPMGFAGRNFVSVDVPRLSLDPEKLSDPRLYPAERYLVVDGEYLPGMEMARQTLPETGGLMGERIPFDQILMGRRSGGGGLKGDADLNIVAKLATRFWVKASGQGDDRKTARIRERAHALAEFLEGRENDVLVTGDEAVAEAAAMMKKMGYHKAMPVVWTGRRAPSVVDGINIAVDPKGNWARRTPRLESAPDLRGALERAPQIDRLPQNFMEVGGVTIKNFEKVADRAIRVHADQPSAGRNQYMLHVMMTDGNGLHEPGDKNAYGHFGMAVEDPKTGKMLVWTIQYNDAGSFTGGLGEREQLTLGEYLYALWYMPGATGQAGALSEAASGRVIDFVLRIDETAVEDMRREAAEINQEFLKGRQEYSFVNTRGLLNCDSMVSRLMKAAGFALPDPGRYVPADFAYNLIRGLARRLLTNQFNPFDISAVVFERPAHAGPEHYRIPNTPLASPMFSRKKAWWDMSWWERAWRIALLSFNTWRATRIPAALDNFASMADVRVSVPPGSREAVIHHVVGAPLEVLRRSTTMLKELRKARSELEKKLDETELGIIELLGFKGWRKNPEEVEKVRQGLPEDSARRLSGLEKAYAEMELARKLNRIDEQIHQATMLFVQIQLADAERRYAGRLGRLKEEYWAKALLARQRVAQGQKIGPAELDEMHELNEKAVFELYKIRRNVLIRAGTPVPPSIKDLLTGPGDWEELKPGHQGKGKTGKPSKKD